MCMPISVLKAFLCNTIMTVELKFNNIHIFVVLGIKEFEMYTIIFAHK